MTSAMEEPTLVFLVRVVTSTVVAAWTWWYVYREITKRGER